MAILKIKNETELKNAFEKMNGKITDKMLYDYGKRFKDGYELEIDTDIKKGKWRTPIKK